MVGEMSIIDETKQEFPLLDTIEIIKVLISRGQRYQNFYRTNPRLDPLGVLEQIQAQNMSLDGSQKHDYQSSYKTSYHKMLEEKYAE